MTERTCTVDGCDRKHRAKGYCASHYNSILCPDRHITIIVCANPECGKAYTTTRTNGMYCSLYCRDAQRRASKAIVGPLPWAASVRSTWNGHTIPSPRRMFVSGSCAWCGNQFTSPVPIGGSTPRCCTDRCNRKRLSARHDSRFRPSLILRTAVYERDEWTCALCGDPVDRDGDPCGNWAPSLDHIECQSWTLKPDHSASNLRTAHRWCNSVRGDERTWVAADLAA